MLKRIFSSRYIKIAIALALFMSVLLVLIPLITIKLIPDKTSDHDNDQASYEKIILPDSAEIYRTTSGKTEKIPFEDYITGVVSCEMPSSFHPEALKAQAVAARTYAAAKITNSASSGNPSAHPAAPLCDTTHCQVYKSEKELRTIKGKQWIKKDFKKICSAVRETEGKLLYYDGKLVQQALFHSSSGGMTENSEDVFAAAVPYLVSVESPYEDEATHQNEKTSFTIDMFASKLKSFFPNTYFGQITSENIKIVNRSNGGRVDKMNIGLSSLTGRQIREALGLSSANFKIDIKGDTITFTSNGSGHGVGMSQYGANGMAKEGYTYKKILSHYYSGTEVY